jgi:IclR family pca regulon transcriptional regulator
MAKMFGMRTDQRDEQKSDSEQIAGLAKGLAIIEAFGHHRAPLSISRAAEIAGLSRAAARRCLRTLQKCGFVQFDNEHYQLTARALRLGQAYVASNPLPRLVQPIIETISQRGRHSMTVTVLDDTEAVVIARALVQRVLLGGMALGTRLPAYCSANGHVLLSELPEAMVRDILQRSDLRRRTPHTRVTVAEILRELRAVRAQGYAINDQEVERSVRSIAIPLRNRQGAIIASISVAAPSTVTDRRYLLKLLPDIEAVRTRIQGAL